VKFTPLSLTLEELSRVWSILFQIRYALSIAYRASAVLIEPRLRTTPSLLVREPLLNTIPIRQPLVSRVVAAPDETAPIFSGGTIAVLGERLRAEDMEVLIGGNTVAPASLHDVHDERIELTLPGGLPAGPLSLQVRHLVLMGKLPVPHPAFQSNPGDFVLHPLIEKSLGNYLINVSNVTGAGANPRSADIAITLIDTVRRGQMATLELLRQGGVFRTFFAAARATDTVTVAFSVTNVPPAIYVARVRVDGAESPLDLDTTVGSPTFGQPIAPAVDLT
jgi:hypothetical protein